ncbi:MAG: hypothetical protein DDT38_01627 [Firmicutes bacterium]|nr:hypothetical protein [candidate division NPL-UPA2 bacterium]
MTGFSWNISYTRDLHFFARETNVAPFALTNNFRDMQVKRTREQYRNQQIVRAGQDQTDVRTERFRGDGTLKSFLLSLPVATVPTVTVNGTAQTVGIRGLETGRAWYWQKGDSTITQDDVPAALGTADNLAVTYRGQFPILLVAQKTDEIRTRAAVEGGTGIYEALFNDQNIDGVILAEQKAEGLLRRYGRIPQTVTCETDAPGLAAGQMITITVPAHNLHGQYLIDSVQAVDIAGRLMRYRVRALDGEHLGGWVEFFQAMAAAGRQFVIRENEVLIRQSLFGPNVILCGDSITISSASPESRIGHLMIGFGEVA